MGKMAAALALLAVGAAMLAGCVAPGDDSGTTAWKAYMAGSYSLPQGYVAEDPGLRSNQPGLSAENPGLILMSANDTKGYLAGNAPNIYLGTYVNPDGQPRITSIVMEFPTAAALELYRANEDGGSRYCATSAGLSTTLVHGRFLTTQGFFTIMGPLPSGQVLDRFVADVASVVEQIKAATGAVDACTVPRADTQALASYVATLDDMPPGWTAVPNEGSGHDLLAAWGLASSPGSVDRAHAGNPSYASMFWPAGDSASAVVVVARLGDTYKHHRAEAGGEQCNVASVMWKDEVFITVQLAQRRETTGARPALVDAVAGRLAGRLGAPLVCDLPQWRPDGNDAKDNATMLHDGANGPFELKPSRDTDWYRFDLDALRVVVVRFHGVNPAPWDLQDAAGLPLRLQPVPGESPGNSSQLLDPGSYFIRIGNGASTGPYSIDLERRDPAAYYADYDNRWNQATTLATGQNGPYIIDGIHDEDWFAFALVGPSHVSLTASASGGAVAFKVLRDELGWLLKGLSPPETQSGAPDAANMKLEQGTFYVRVVATSGMPSYSLALTVRACRPALFQYDGSANIAFCGHDSVNAPGGTMQVVSVLQGPYPWQGIAVRTGDRSTSVSVQQGAECQWPTTGNVAIGDTVTCTTDGPFYFFARDRSHAEYGVRFHAKV